MTRPPDPLGPHEVAELLGISRQRVTQLIAAGNFPAPWATLATGRIWRDVDVEAWAAKTGRAVRRLEPDG